MLRNDGLVMLYGSSEMRILIDMLHLKIRLPYQGHNTMNRGPGYASKEVML